MKTNGRNQWDCESCYHLYHDGTCDMCAYGHPYTIDNNGLLPQEVKDCNAYVKDDKMNDVNKIFKQTKVNK